MDKESQQKSGKLETSLKLCNSKEFLSLWSNVVEESVLNAGNITEPKEGKHLKVMVKSCCRKRKIRFLESLISTPTKWNPTPKLRALKLQARRITAMQELLACLSKKKVKTPRWREEIRKQTRNTIEKLVRDTDLSNAREK